MWQNSKIKIVTKLKKMVTTLKTWNCEKSQKIKLWQNSKTRIMTKLKKLNCDKTQKLKLWQNSKTQIVTKLKNSNCDKTKKNQIATKLEVQIVTVAIVTDADMFSGQLLAIIAMFYLHISLDLSGPSLASSLPVARAPFL